MYASIYFAVIFLYQKKYKQNILLMSMSFQALSWAPNSPGDAILSQPDEENILLLFVFLTFRLFRDIKL